MTFLERRGCFQVVVPNKNQFQMKTWTAKRSKRRSQQCSKGLFVSLKTDHVANDNNNHILSVRRQGVEAGRKN